MNRRLACIEPKWFSPAETACVTAFTQAPGERPKPRAVRARLSLFISACLANMYFLRFALYIWLYSAIQGHQAMRHPKKLKVHGGIWLGHGDRPLLGDERIALLEQIGNTGSITRAAKACGMSYKKAWDSVNEMNNLSERPLVTSAVGGKGGGGAQLTDAARKLIEVYRQVHDEHQSFLAAASAGIEDFADYYPLIRRLSMKSSARNQFFGTVTRIHRGAVNAEVELQLNPSVRIVATITLESVDSLGLRVGGGAWALVKASWVLIARADQDPKIKLSVRNCLCGSVTRIVPGAVNGEVMVTLPGGATVTAIVTNDSVTDLALETGKPACAIFKASSVILGVNT
jgi:molybdate transport system regulatory protein